MEQPKQEGPIQENRSIRQQFGDLFRNILQWFRQLINLEEGMDREGTIVYIKNSKRIRGSSAWLLICSIMIASLGLDLNSPAVIIGAMLISPLMSPILGVGLGIATNDRESTFISLQHFSVAILIALTTSILYFSVTPLGDITDEIRARTAPTLLDSMIAIFGGLAGIISVSRKEKSSAIPGVAIATALMPPLCVTGYGIANGNWSITLNSFYLFFLNSFFISISTFVIIRLMKFPYKSFLDRKEARRNRLAILVISLILLLPSGKILLDLLQNRSRDARIEAYIGEFFRQNPNTNCLDYDYIEGDSINQLYLGLPQKVNATGVLFLSQAGRWRKRA